MPKMSDVMMLYQRKQPVLSIRTRTRVEDLPMLIGSSYTKIAAYLGEIGEMMADIPFVAYFNMDMSDLDVEIGFPVVKELPGRDDIKPSFLPEGKTVVCMYRGDYSKIEPVYLEMMDYIKTNKLEAIGSSYEFYFNGPGFPEEEFLTKIVMPVK